MTMARCHWPLICSPQPIARLLRALPKLAIIFLAVHFILMIYSVLNQPTSVSKKDSRDQDRNLKPLVDHVRLTGNLSQDKVTGTLSRLNKTKLQLSKIRNSLLKKKVIGRTAHGLFV